MARSARENMKYRSTRVEGNLAYAPGYEERIRQTERTVREPMPHRRAEVKAEPRRRVRQRQKLSPMLLLGFAALAGMVVVLLMSYARLTELSNSVVALKSDISELQEEHVKLLASYEKTFDLATIKEAAEAAGMSKPSSSQIYYVDLSVPDNVVVYEQTETNVLSRLLTSFGHTACSMVEYFR